MIVVADQSKQVNTLGNFPLPIEVTPFAHECTMNEIKEILDCEVIIRKVDETYSIRIMIISFSMPM